MPRWLLVHRFGSAKPLSRSSPIALPRKGQAPPRYSTGSSLKASRSWTTRASSSGALPTIGAPDVWEIVSRLQELDGAQEHRVNVLAAESDLHPRLIRLALDYAAERPLEIRERIKRNREAIAHSQAAVGEREKLLAA